MNWKTLAGAASAATTVLGASSAFANPPNWAPAYGWHAKRHHHHRPRPVVVYRPAPVYYVPAPVYYAPPPRPRLVVPAPVIYGHVPVSPHLGISFGLRL
jgi:hypothetical protein